MPIPKKKSIKHKGRQQDKKGGKNNYKEDRKQLTIWQ